MNKTILVLLTSWLLLPKPAGEQTAYMVWARPCLTNVAMTAKSYLEAPMIDGKPDYSRARVYGVVATYEPDCGRIEIRRER